MFHSSENSSVAPGHQFYGVSLFIALIMATFFVPFIAKMWTPLVYLATPFLVVGWINHYKKYLKSSNTEINRQCDVIKKEKCRAQGALDNILVRTRRIRHEVNNQVQLAYGYAQLENHQRILEPLDKIHHISKSLGTINKLTHYELISFFLNQYAASFEYACQFYIENKIEWDKFKPSLVKKAAWGLELMDQMLVQNYFYFSSAKIYWYLGEKNSTYFFSLTISDLKNRGEVISPETFKRLQAKIESEPGLGFAYDSQKGWATGTLLVYKNFYEESD